MEEQRKYGFVDFLIQLIFVVLFVIVLVWLFPTKDYIANNYNGISEKEVVNADETFINNIERMYDASESYFGYDVALPVSIDDEVKVTLKELVDNHIIISPKDKKGKVCDLEESYATITKTNVGYSIKVSLTCGDTTDYIIRNIGCNPFCESNCNQVCTKEYQYVKTTNGYWTKWSNFSNWSTKKVTPSNTVKVETKKVATKTCPTGYSLNSDSTACIKASSVEVIEQAKINYSCPTGYTLNGTICSKKQSTTTIYGATETLTCPSGYTLNGNTCTKTTTINSTVSTYYGCISGYTYVSSNKTCIRVRTLDSFATATGQNCSISFETVCNDSCRVVQKETCIVNANKNYSYKCPSGYIMSSNKKTCSLTENREVSRSYSCKTGTLVNNTCVVDNESVDTIDAFKNYTCSVGTLVNTNCVSTDSKIETTKYEILNVMYYRYATKTWINGSTTYKWSTSKEDKKLINVGYKLTGKDRNNCNVSK